MVQIVCSCRQLVEVVDKKIVDHESEGERCPASGLKYLPQKIKSPWPGGPSVEILAEGPLECPNCGDEHGYGVLAAVSQKDPTLN